MLIVAVNTTGSKTDRNAAIFVAVLITFANALTGCYRLSETERTVLLGGVHNTNSKCVGHADGLCGPEDQSIRQNFESAFATDSDCEGLKVRELTREEGQVPIRNLRNYVSLEYVGKPHSDPYYGTGKGENGDWTFLLNGPDGIISGTVGTEEEAVRRACRAVKGRGGEVQSNSGVKP